MEKHIVLLNGSPRKENGNTAFFSQYFIEGLAKSGCAIDTHYLYDIDFERCTGCHNCWKTKTCIHNDGLSVFIEHLLNAQLIVFAVPLYFCTMPAKVKDFIERLSPYVSPLMDADSRHKKTDIPDFALISTCFYNEPDHFKPLSATFKEMCYYLNIDYAFELIVPAAPYIIDHKENFQNILDAIYQGGLAFGRDKHISADLLMQITDNQIPKEKLLKYHNDLY